MGNMSDNESIYKPYQFDAYDLEGDIDNAIQKLKDIKKRFRGEKVDLTLEMESEPYDESGREYPKFYVRGIKK